MAVLAYINGPFLARSTYTHRIHANILSIQLYALCMLDLLLVVLYKII